MLLCCVQINNQQEKDVGRPRRREEETETEVQQKQMRKSMMK